MNIEGEKFQVIDTLNSPITVPDCFVKRDSKIGTGNGEAKLYIAPKTIMHTFLVQTNSQPNASYCKAI